MGDTAMKEAFQKAGLASAEERLREIALKSMVAFADDTHACIENIWGIVNKSPDLMASLFFQERHRVIGMLLHNIRADIAAKEAAGKPLRPIERKGAVIVRDFRKQQRADEEENARGVAEYNSRMERERQVRLDALYARWEATPIGHVRISGTPVWQLTPGTVRTWLHAEGRRHRCMELLIAGLPEDGHPIEYYRRPEDVAAMWKASE